MALMRQDVSWNRESNGSSNNIAPIIASNTDPLAFIYNEGLWSVHHVTPLYNLAYQEVKLKFYASKVKYGLVSSVQKSSLKYMVKFEVQPYLRYYEEDASGLMITVTSSAENNMKSKVVYMAILLSWGVSKSLPGSIHLPFMLERGDQKVGTSVKATLQTIFDCNITRYHFTQNQLLSFGFNFLDNDSSKSTDPFIMIYKTPQVEHNDKITLTFEMGDISLVWNRLKHENSSHREKSTYQVLINQIFHKSELDLKCLELLEVKTAKAEVKSSGAVKVKTAELTNCMFSVLNEINQAREFDIISTKNTTVDE